MKKIYPIKLCPWCKRTPKFYMFLGMGNQKEETWLPNIHCNNHDCKVQPKSKYVPIRKDQKKNPEVIKIKLEKLINYWNDNNPMQAVEGIELDFDSIVQMS